jgi:hypothetical protein
VGMKLNDSLERICISCPTKGQRLSLLICSFRFIYEILFKDEVSVPLPWSLEIGWGGKVIARGL